MRRCALATTLKLEQRLCVCSMADCEDRDVANGKPPLPTPGRTEQESVHHFLPKATMKLRGAL